MKKLSESEFTTMFGWNYKEYLKEPVLVEHKVCDNTFNIKGWKTGKQGHQYLNLKEAFESGYYWKIPDTDRTTKPADGFFVNDGALIVWFNKHKRFAIFPIKIVDSFGNNIEFKDIHKKYLYKLLPKEEKRVISF